jgi:serine/threonine protein kinase
VNDYHPLQVTMSEIWTRCEGRAVNGVFPLRRLLGSSDHSAVFLSEWPARNLPDVAVKLVPAHPALARLQLAHWSAAAALSHAHLLPLFETGRWQLDERHFLFAVMQYAEENLAQVLPQRALTSDEVRHLLPPVIEALTFLHGNKLVHGRLKPSNILVIKDEVKLSSDGVRAAGESTSVADAASVYDPPEARMGRISPAGDIWSLGMTVAEALTQQLPQVPHERWEPIVLPAGIPPDFADMLRKCLSRDPENRPSIVALRAEFTQSAPSQPLPVPLLPSREAPSEPKPRRSLWVSALVALAVLLFVAWGARRVLHGHSATEPNQIAPAVVPPPTPPVPTIPPSRASTAPEKSAPDIPATADPVVEKSIPQVSRVSRDTIHGRIKVSVRVTVDPSGNVVDETLEMAGPSKYFARLSTDAARKWKFIPAPDQSSRQWLLWFEFTHEGATGHVQ